MTGINKRAFILGSTRSGTTLLESLMGAHPRIKAFPESSFFICSIGQIDNRVCDKSEVSLKNRLGRPLSNARVHLGIPHRGLTQKCMREFLASINRTELMNEFPVNSNSMTVLSNAFVQMLDRLAMEDGKELWVEKSPMHLFYVDEITRYVKSAKFINIVRNGSDVVASLFDASRLYPEHWWWSRFASLDACVNHWNHSLKSLLTNQGKANHITICYEQLVDATPFVLQKLCAFLETEYDEAMLVDYRTVATSVSVGEPWRAKTSDVIANANGEKFRTLLTESQQAYVAERLAAVDYSQFSLS